MRRYPLHDCHAPNGFTPDATVFADVKSVVVGAFNHEGYGATNYGILVGSGWGVPSVRMDPGVVETLVTVEFGQSGGGKDQTIDFVSREINVNGLMLGATRPPFSIVPGAPFELEDALGRIMRVKSIHQTQIPPWENGVLLIPIPNAALRVRHGFAVADVDTQFVLG